MGPSCPNDASNTFPGSSKWNREPKKINHVLSYSAPLKDHMHVAADSKSLEMTIHYAEDLDEQSFSVEPAYYRARFEPKAGTTQTVLLPLKKDDGKTIIKLEARSVLIIRSEQNPSYTG